MEDTLVLGTSAFGRGGSTPFSGICFRSSEGEHRTRNAKVVRSKRTGSSMNRRSFIGVLIGVTTLDPERILRQTYFIQAQPPVPHLIRGDDLLVCSKDQLEFIRKLSGIPAASFGVAVGGTWGGISRSNKPGFRSSIG